MANTIFRNMGNVVGTKFAALRTELINLIGAETSARESAVSALQSQVTTNSNASYSKAESDTKYLNSTTGVAADSAKLGGNPASFYGPAVHSHGDEYIKPTGGTITGNLTVNGTVTATELIETSALRYKDNIEAITDADVMVSKLQGVRYTLKDSGKEQIGFIAEDVNEIVPELVMKNEDGSVEGINYSKMTALLVEVVNKQQAEIDELKKLIK
jgi:hypothetical protein